MLSVQTRRLPVSGNKRDMWPSELLCSAGRRRPRQSRGCVFPNCIWSSDKCLENGLVTFQHHWAFCMSCMDNGIMNSIELILMTKLYHVRNVTNLSSTTLQPGPKGRSMTSPHECIEAVDSTLFGHMFDISTEIDIGRYSDWRLSSM